MKERLREMISSFFISVTLINIAILVLGLIFRPEQKFGYEVFVYPLIYGMIGVIPTLVINVNRELTVKQVVIRKAIEMVLIIVLLLAFIFGGLPADRANIPAAAGVAVSVVIIYVLVTLISWLLDVRTAGKMTEDLLRFQEEQMGKSLE